jgi:ATP-dependent helicase/nuclease subunit A
VNLCRAIQNVDDQVSLVGVLRSPFFGLSDDTLFALWSEHHDFEKALRGPPPACLSEEQRDQVEHASVVLAELRANKDRMPSHTLLEHAIARTGYDAALLAEFLGPRKLANLRKLLDTARTLDRAGVFTMADLVEHLQGAVTTEPREALAATHPETSDVIRMMSIHQSKGLEFPVVVVVDMDRKPNTLGPRAVFDPALGPLVRLPSRFEETRENPGMLLYQQQEVDENLAETYRLLYVATTRAADFLLLSARMAKAGEFESPWMNLLHRKFDLRTGQPRASVLVKHSKTLPQIRCHSQPPDVVPVKDPSESRRLPLDQLRAAVDGEPDDPDAWPLLARPLPPNPAALRRFSVSLLRVKARYTVHQMPTGVTTLRGREAEWLGSIVHAVLEQADFGQDEDLPKMVDAAILSGEFDVSPTVRDAAVTSVTALLQSPLAKELATARRCYRELEFLLHWPDDRRPRLVAGTLDCLFETSTGQWVVFDYKTKVLPAGTKHDELLREYELQLGVYCLAVKEMLDRLPDRVELVLIRDGVQRLSLTPTEEFTRHIADRVRQAMDAAGERWSVRCPEGISATPVLDHRQ